MASSASVSLSARTETEYFSLLINYAVEHQFAVALWRLPNDSRTHLIISHEPQSLPHNKPLEDIPSGFIVAPFETVSDRLFLKADYSFTFSSGQLNQPITPLEIASNVWLTGLLGKESTVVKRPLTYSNSKDTLPSTSRDFFLRLVSNAIHEIEMSSFEKVVLSRTEEITLPEDFDISLAFEKLSGLYTNALISFVSIPAYGSWLGASPELLISVDGKHTFKTTALAGTQPYNDGINLKSVAWTQKDIEEQALVERYIISCFKKIRLREYEEHGPRTVVAGNLMHLKSDFTVDMQATNFPQLGSVMLQLLHPTSAVCGVPLDTSLEFIRRHEGYDRQFYSGYIGPVNFQDRIDIFVNLRCLQMWPGKAVLYAGAGITQDSIRENEWEETELKLNTLLKIVR